MFLVFFSAGFSCEGCILFSVHVSKHSKGSVYLANKQYIYIYIYIAKEAEEALKFIYKGN